MIFTLFINRGFGDQVNYFEVIKNRLTFQEMLEMCRRYSLPTAQGWDRLLSKLEIDNHETDKALTKCRLEQTLFDIFKETLTVGNRAVRVFDINEEHLPDFYNFFKQASPEPSIYLDSYPNPADELELRADVSTDLYLVDNAASDDESSITLTFCGRRNIEERETRDRTEIGSDVINSFGWQSYDEFILIRRKPIQAFEVVRLDTKRSLVEIRVENKMGSDSGIALDNIIAKFTRMLFQEVGLGFNLMSPKNLFPAIKSIYDDASEGIVAELGFTTETGSAKHEKMRTSRSDLRTELFHAGGKAAVGGFIAPFRLGVRWSHPNQRPQIEALLPGSIRQLSSPNPILDHMMISGAVTEDVMRNTIDRVLCHASP